MTLSYPFPGSLRVARRLLLGLLLAGAAPALLSDSAHAASVANLSVEQMTDASTYVVRGTVSEIWTELESDGVVWTRARVQVSDVLKGPEDVDELVVDSIGGEVDGLRMKVPGAPVFSEGENLLLFLDRFREGRFTPVAMHRGKYTVRRAPGERRHHVMTWHPMPGETFDARFIPHPPPERRVYLDDMLERIEERLEEGWDGQPVPGLTHERLETINTPERRRR